MISESYLVEVIVYHSVARITAENKVKPITMAYLRFVHSKPATWCSEWPNLIAGSITRLILCTALDYSEDTAVLGRLLRM